MNLFDLIAKISVDSSGYTGGLNQASAETQTFGNNIGSVFGNIGKAFGIVAGVATAVTGTVTAVGGTMVAATTKAVNSTAEYGDEIDKMSQKMGISAEAYQEWDFVMQHCGSSMDSLKASMKTLATAAQTDSDAFAQLGITQEEIANLSQEDLFNATITALQGVSDETERTYLTGKLLGRGATELGALLNMSAEDTQAMKDQLHELGGVMSDESVKASAAYEDSLQNLQTASGSLMRGLTGEFLPGVTSVMDGLTAIFGGNADAGAEKLIEGFTSIGDKITTVLPKLMETGVQVAEAIITSLVDAFPEMLERNINIFQELSQKILAKLPDFIKTVLNGFATIMRTEMAALPEIYDMMFDVLDQIVEILNEILPDLIPVIIEFIMTVYEIAAQQMDKMVGILIDVLDLVINALIAYALPAIMKELPVMVEAVLIAITKLIPTLISGLLQLLASIVLSLVQAIMTYIGEIPSICQKIKDTFLNAGWADLGRNIIDGLIGGLKDKLGALGDTAKEMAEKLKNTFANIFDIHSPSKLFAYYGRMLDEGLALGIENNADGVLDSIEGMSASMTDAMSETKLNTAFGTTGGGNARLQTAGMGDIIIPVYLGQELLDTMVVKAIDRANYRSGGR